MAQGNEKLAAALEAASVASQDGIVRSDRLSWWYRERLVEAGFLRPIINGWYFLSKPAVPEGSSSIRYAAYWSYLRQYLQERRAEYLAALDDASQRRNIRPLARFIRQEMEPEPSR